jgi:two-component system, NarL family, response regulator NreC
MAATGGIQANAKTLRPGGRIQQTPERPSPMINIILADDHQVIRQKIRHLLAQEPAWQVSAETDDGLEAVRLVKELKPDVLVTDLAMPGLHGLQVMRRIQRQSPRPRVVVVSIHDDEQYVRQALRNGALGYVRKEEVRQHLLPAIRSALLGNVYLSPSLAEMAPLPAGKRRSSPAPDADGASKSLSPRDRSFLLLVSQGYTDTEIAFHLRLTIARAEHLRSQLMRRLHLRTDVELATLVSKLGLAEPAS